MRILIVEDEKPAVDKLKLLLARYSSEIIVLDTFASVRESIEWLKFRQHEVDLIFMDIQLEDGVSFEIFSEVELQVPVIFVTAYDEYAIDAFQVNGIDYLLKPVTYTDLSQAMKRLNKLKINLGAKVVQLKKNSALGTRKFKSRFLVKKGNHIQSVKTDQVALFYAEGRTVFLVDQKDRKYIIDYRLEELQTLLDPKNFFRVNRSVILQISSIQDVLVYSNSRLKISVSVSYDKDIIVSRDKVGSFKEWLD